MFIGLSTTVLAYLYPLTVTTSSGALGASNVGRGSPVTGGVGRLSRMISQLRQFSAENTSSRKLGLCNRGDFVVHRPIRSINPQSMQAGMLSTSTIELTAGEPAPPIVVKSLNILKAEEPCITGRGYRQPKPVVHALQSWQVVVSCKLFGWLQYNPGSCTQL